jgi:hypothetical protein
LRSSGVPASRRAMKRFRAPNMVVSGCGVCGEGEGGCSVFELLFAVDDIDAGGFEDRCWGCGWCGVAIASDVHGGMGASEPWWVKWNWVLVLTVGHVDTVSWLFVSVVCY